ncbi:hypothetical protein ACFL4G_07485 [Thermodesulfobacteriota bacterium]
MKRIFIFLFCLIALLLPWRLRIAYANVLAYVFQAIYWLVTSLTRTIVKGLEDGKKST